ncbi:MAG TPA: Gfo/Idh/MocA family oxidoreductase [Allosphingosinicella sp.]|jgi:scyllo-inositol 2-dehydrogenase (NADP+)|nr:Gfo/Idh/MocA family oxidoreductase [Allosphingosinicella sp.]
MVLKVALIGRGLGGSAFHAPLIRALPELDLAIVAGAADAEAAAVAEGVDLVVISSPNCTHFPLAEAALRAGKHVVIDKPFTVSVEEADALIALAKERGRMLTVFHNRRWDGDFLTVRKILPRLGELFLFEAHWDRFRREIRPGWKDAADGGAGTLNDLGPHLIDQALQLFGMPEALSADVLAQREGATVDDYFALTLHYGRMRAVLGASTLVQDPRPRFALHGTQGSFVKYGLDPQEAALKEGADPRSLGEDAPANDGTLTTAAGTERVPTEKGRYLGFYEAVVAAIRDGAPPPVDPAHAREGLWIIELARRSSEEGRQFPL